jgi:hypothetical protein
MKIFTTFSSSYPLPHICHTYSSPYRERDGKKQSTLSVCAYPLGISYSRRICVGGLKRRFPLHTQHVCKFSPHIYKLIRKFLAFAQITQLKIGFPFSLLSYDEKSSFSSSFCLNCWQCKFAKCFLIMAQVSIIAMKRVNFLCGWRVSESLNLDRHTWLPFRRLFILSIIEPRCLEVEMSKKKKFTCR